MYYEIGKAVRRLVVDKIRTKFSNPLDPEVVSWLWNATENLTKIQIYDKQPAEEAFRPAIIVTSAAPATTGEWGFGQYMGRETETTGTPPITETYDKYGGKVRMTITLTVESLTQPNVESLADTLLVGLADGQDLRGLLQSEGVTFEPDSFAKIGNESIRQLDNLRSIFGVSINFPVFVGWKRYKKVVAETMDNEGVTLTHDVS